MHIVLSGMVHLLTLHGIGFAYVPQIPVTLPFRGLSSYRTPPITSVRVGAANRTNPAVVVELAILLLEWVHPDSKSLIVFNHILLAPIWILERI